MLKLYSYFRSSAAFRVRIALALKGLDWQAVPVNLLNKEHKDDAYTAVNPQGLVPVLHVEQQNINQSMAIIEYLDERYPEVMLLPADALQRAQVRALAYQMVMDIHPLNNLRVLNYLQRHLACDDTSKQAWYGHWIDVGFSAFEQSLSMGQSNGLFCFSDKASLADVCLIPQVYNAQRFNCDLTAYPLIQSIWQHCISLPAFANAAPEMQPDCPKNT
jgi:maleylpyruvate isomerase